MFTWYEEVAANILCFLMRLFCSSYRFKISGEYKIDQVKAAGERIIFAVWHQATFVMFPLYRNRQTAIITSPELRGRILARCAEKLGFRAFPLVSNRRATVELLRALANGHEVVIAVDGPLGPLYEVKEGVSYLAHKAKATIIPIGVRATQKVVLFWRWDKYFVPLPFSEVEINVGEPSKATKPKNQQELCKDLLSLS